MERNHKINFDDPEVRRMVEELKHEIARENGLKVPRDGYWGHAPSKVLGKIGSQLRKRVAVVMEYKEKKRM